MGKQRKDNKGRILKTGESQRKDGLYQYRYTDLDGKRHTVYDPDLKTLRDKEFEIEQQLRSGGRPVSNITLLELLHRYVDLNRSIRETTRLSYQQCIRTLSQDPIVNKKIKDLKSLDGKRFLIRLDEKYRYKTTETLFNFVKAALKMAVNDGDLLRMPFCFSLSDIIADNDSKREALTPEQQKEWLRFIRNDGILNKYYDYYVVLLETGLRVSEFCGLTMKDLDFRTRKITIDHQLLYHDGKYHIGKLKTKSSIRTIPMTEKAYQSLLRLSEKRHKAKKICVDGYTDFILVNQSRNPRVAHDLCTRFRDIYKKYKRLYPNSCMPNVTAHVLRHTFCSNMVREGINIKTLQYLMGHSSAITTLDIYSHIDYLSVESQVRAIEERNKN
ncbi:MAG TPA: site-specific integrase [Lachnospiraceae bacterium]|nr:site-specific integrase [Lachnospiraceae bacterium]